MSVSYPETLEIQPLTKPPAATIRVPGSKSITNRALVLAALSDPLQGSELRGVLHSEDTEVMIEALRALGFRVQTQGADVIHVRRGEHPYPIPAKEADLFVGNSGTSMRFLTAMVSLGHGRYRLDGVTRMRERPMADLLAALQQLGVNAYSERGDGYPPIIVESRGLQGGKVQMRGDVSSQFLSGLLMAAPLAKKSIDITLDGPLVSVPYVAMTVAMMSDFGAHVQTFGLDDEPRPNGSRGVNVLARQEIDELESEEKSANFEAHIVAGQSYSCTSFEIEPDASAASYFLGAAAIMHSEVTVPGLDTCTLQGDLAFVDVLEDMGCSASFGEPGITMKGAPLRGIDVDMNDISDTVMTLAAVACFAEDPTTIRNVAHIRHKETDRLAALAAELRKVGAEVEEYPDGLKITPRPLHGAVIETYNDHRMAMSMALIGLKVPGIVIKNPGCVAKTYPNFFEDLERLRG